MATKLNYTDASNKKAVRKVIFDRCMYHRPFLKGLAGPNIDEYLKWCKERGYHNVDIYEMDWRVMQLQMTKLNDKIGGRRYMDLKFHMDNINKCCIHDNVATIYDLDYCCTIATVKDEIKRFKDVPFAMTFSLRARGGEKATIKTFFKSMGEKITKYQEACTEEGVEYSLYDTSSGNFYAYFKYRDTSPMCCFVKVDREL